MKECNFELLQTGHMFEAVLQSLAVAGCKSMTTNIQLVICLFTPRHSTQVTIKAL